MLKNKTLDIIAFRNIKILSSKWMNWCRKCSVPIHEKITCFKGVARGYKVGLQPETLADGIGWWNKVNRCRKLKLNLTQTWGVCMSLDSELHWSQYQWYCDDKPIKEWIQSSRSKRTQSLKHSFKKVSVSHAQLAHFSTLAKEKHMLLILNFSTLTFITNANAHQRHI